MIFKWHNFTVNQIISVGKEYNTTRDLNVSSIDVVIYAEKLIFIITKL